jgi:hypothetical protein
MFQKIFVKYTCCYLTYSKIDDELTFPYPYNLRGAVSLELWTDEKVYK